jgi:hypothetical protein
MKPFPLGWNMAPEGRAGRLIAAPRVTFLANPPRDIGAASTRQVRDVIKRTPPPRTSDFILCPLLRADPSYAWDQKPQAIGVFAASAYHAAIKSSSSSYSMTRTILVRETPNAKRETLRDLPAASVLATVDVERSASQQLCADLDRSVNIYQLI